jgi:hypothetical protein
MGPAFESAARQIAQEDLSAIGSVAKGFVTVWRILPPNHRRSITGNRGRVPLESAAGQFAGRRERKLCAERAHRYRATDNWRGAERKTNGRAQ